VDLNDATLTVSSTTPPGKTTTAISNTRGLPASVKEPSGQTTTFTTYDAEGSAHAEETTE